MEARGSRPLVVVQRGSSPRGVPAYEVGGPGREERVRVITLVPLALVHGRNTWALAAQVNWAEHMKGNS